MSEDTIELLRECDAGVKMGIASLDQVLDKIQDKKMQDIIGDSKNAHAVLENELRGMIDKAGAQPGEPNPIAKGMSWMKTNFKTCMEAGDKTIADLITEGGDMGVKSLRKYLNQYERADKESKDMCRQIIDTEEDLRNRMKEFL
ncbi:MAG: hypothetical protein SO172_00440 [Pararoseburia sp.]|nr:hypothetical protein [Pararoseburia sp.]